MRLLILFTCWMIIGTASFAQKIAYDLPQGFEKDISRDDYKNIVDLSLPMIAKRYTIESVKRGVIQIKAGEGMQAFNLDNLILKCIAVADKTAWKNIVQDHFEKIFLAIDEQKKIDPQNYETIKKYLSIRIYPAETVNNRGGVSSMVAKTDLEGTYTLLMLDLPGAFTAVQKQIFSGWKKDSTEVFKVALTNINRQKIEKVTKSFDFDKTAIEVSFLGNEDYAASYALDLVNNSPELVGEWGSVIAMPNKGLVDICKITKAKPVDFVKFIQMTKPLIEKSFQEHPQRISDQYYWYYQGRFTKINVVTDANGNINVIPPFGLTELMTVKQ